MATIAKTAMRGQSQIGVPLGFWSASGIGFLLGRGFQSGRVCRPPLCYSPDSSRVAVAAKVVAVDRMAKQEFVFLSYIVTDQKRRAPALRTAPPPRLLHQTPNNSS